MGEGGANEEMTWASESPLKEKRVGQGTAVERSEQLHPTNATHSDKMSFSETMVKRRHLMKRVCGARRERQKKNTN